MLKNFSKKKLNQKPQLDHLKSENSFLNIFLYLTQAQPERIESLSQFLQKYNIRLGFLTKEKRFSFTKYSYVNANFLAQSTQPISEKDFAAINSFLSSQVIIVSISYQNQIWTLSRFLTWQKSSFQKLLQAQDVNDNQMLNSPAHLLKLKNHQFFPWWSFFNHMRF